jgi:hypothetical protein
MSDDFSDAVKRVLAGRVGYLCSNPECRVPTSGPQDDPGKSVNLGVASHITAASPGGPRHDPYLTAEERSAASNGIWLCQNCAKLIDNDVQRFPIDLLKGWKASAENEAKDRLGKISASLIGDFFMDVAVLNEDASAWKRGDDTIVRYALNRETGKIRIESELGYLALFERGGSITPLEYVMSPTHCPFRWDFPILDFKVLNNRENALFLTEIIFDVEESRVDMTPLLAIKRDTQRRFAGELHLVNEGGCALTDFTISFHLFPGTKATASDISPPYPHSISVPLIEDHVEIDAVDAFRKEGVDIDGLIRLSNDKWEADTQSKWEQFLGRFKDEVGTLAGEMEFGTAQDAGVRHAVKFLAPVFLTNENRMGILRPPTYNYDSAFDVQGTNYRRSVSIAHSLQPGEADRFTAKIGVSQSSYHRFRATLRDVSGMIWQSVPIEMNCFVPRSRQNRVRNAISSEEARRSKI